MATDFTIDNEEASIVFVGSFNPSIFHPEWIFRNGLIPEDEYKSAAVEIVHSDIAKFSLEWLNVDVLRNKFIARTNDPSKFSPLKDLMASIFAILEHTPITALGMNYKILYRFDSEDTWHKIGDKLAPKDIWEESLPRRVGLKTLNVQSPRTDELNGYLNITLTSSRSDFFGITLNVNNHVELKSDENGENTEEYDASQILLDNWDSAIELAKNIGNKTLEKALE